jgi:GH35 family endo-1,4-beta-xylanase
MHASWDSDTIEVEAIFICFEILKARKEKDRLIIESYSPSNSHNNKKSNAIYT